MRAHRTDIELETIVRRIMDDELDLQPEFQRGEIWDERRRRRLIDTILRDWYIPAVHIVRENDRELVLDGQQRLATIRDFFADKLTVDGTTEPFSEEIASYGGLRFSDLPESRQRAFRRFPLPVVYLSGHSPGEPNELFFRLNQSYNLTPPEKRNALHGVARNQVKDLVREMEDWGLLQRERIGFNNQRLAYDDIVARTCVAVERNTLRKHINNNVVEDYYRDQKFSTSTIEAVRQAGRELMSQVVNAMAGVKFNKGTLQTWLLYCHWAPQEAGSIPIDLLARFEHERRRLKRREELDLPRDVERLLSVVSIYDDRASYRVTDVSSVVARDLAIHLFSVGFYATQENRGSKAFIQHLVDHPRYDASSLVFQFADETMWGEPLVERR
ncbi:DUF262 domain-containing protein [Nocardioides sp. SR21]|uniref:DUF262 domain-containing protein n=1 Tax=Nocardioides sp. SR21 TaxID=2919501 RepID=UPI001FA9BAC3|nr:DUF262 domain-containing protein [Nocardioides sp. SR21]